MIYDLIQRWKTSFIFHPMQRFGYRYASELLRRVLKKGCFDPRQIQSICDFGSGLGGPSLALQNCFSQSLKYLVLLEENALQASFARKILPHTECHIGDGLAWLKNTEKRFDLITAFMLGPDYHNEGLVQDFLMLASQRLTDRGAILIASDVATMAVLQSWITALHAEQKLSAVQWIIPQVKLTAKFVKRFSFFQSCSAPSIPYAVILKSHTALSVQTLTSPLEMPSLPEPCFQCVGEDLYCLTTPFEWDYLKATLKTYRKFDVKHSETELLRQLLLRN
jgi:hypothetical protein